MGINNFINIAFSTSEQYVPIFAVALKSLILHSTTSNNYNIFVLNNGITPESQKILTKECENYSNINIKFINVSEFIHPEDFNYFYEKGYVTNETYYRLYLPQIFSNLDKIIYSDVDVVFNKDISELYKIELDDFLLAAAPNISAIYNYNRNNKLENGIYYRYYFDNIVKIKNIENYIQAGICVYNLRKMRAFSFIQKCFEELKRIKKPVFFDQDIVSAVCQNNIKLLSVAWNHVWYFWEYDFLKQGLPEKLFNDYDKSRNMFYVCHYAGPKPIIEKTKPLAWYFWKYAMQTQFFEYFLQQAYGEDTKLLDIKDNLFENLTIEPKFKEQIAILYSSSDNYAPYLGVSIFSLLQNMDPKINYDILVLETSIDENYKDKITNMVKEYPNCSVRFINVQEELKIYNKIFYIHYPLSYETYYRLFTDKIFKSYNKMIYIDADTLILDNLKELYNLNIKDCYIAGTKDYVLQSRYKNKVHINNIDIYDYFKNFITFDYTKYVQCGVLLLNLKEFRKSNFLRKAIFMLQYLKNPYFVDQDIINKVSEDRVYYLGPEYNYMQFYRNQNIKNIAEEFRDEIQKAKSKIKIFHMPGGKPDQFPHYEFSGLYFKYALASPFAGEIINRITEQKITILQWETKILTNILKFNKKKKDYYRYKWLSKLTFGKTKQRYLKKYKKLKALKQCLRYLKI